MKHFNKAYDNLWSKLSTDKDAAQKAVGGDFDTVGYIELQVLKAAGLTADAYLIDVGCGSGRLASQLAGWSTGRYLGTDILQGLLDHARSLCNRPDWRFEVTQGLEIPESADMADMVAFFSVFTHLTHEETWHYIRETNRVLKPGGKLVLSFLEFAVYSHWTIFANSVSDSAPNKILNQFLSRDALHSFAHHGGFEVEGFLDGDKPNIVIDRTLVWQDGRQMSGFANLGQSTCVMVKKSR